MAKLIQLTLKTGQTIWVNPDRITLAVPATGKENTVSITVAGETFYVAEDEFRATVLKDKTDEAVLLSQRIAALTQAVQRLTIQIPTSIRLHM